MARVVGSETRLLWCYSDTCVSKDTPHVNIVFQKTMKPAVKSECGRRITARCSECGYRDREGYVIYERQEGK